ncbi:MAG: carboxypeptidase-like regulatory domain-containing protein [Acidobacteriia bacterium]|nr:carboxypeptidase-like regulatory domain-containing protein [Terriglobia bacterium]
MTLSRYLTTLFTALYLSSAIHAQESRIRIDIEEGEGALNDARHATPRALILAVRDEMDRPVSGVKVTLTAPYSGPGVIFPGGARTWTGTTDAEGRVAVQGVIPNKIEGRFVIRATAEFQGQEAMGTIAETNTLAAEIPQGGHKSKKTLIILAIAGGAGAGIAVAMSGGKSSTPVIAPAATTLGISGISVGGPR